MPEEPPVIRHVAWGAPASPDPDTVPHGEHDAVLALFEFADALDWALKRWSIRSLLTDIENEQSFESIAAWPRLAFLVQECGAKLLDEHPQRRDALRATADRELSSWPEVVPDIVYKLLALPIDPMRFRPSEQGRCGWNDGACLWPETITLAGWIGDLLFPRWLPPAQEPPDEDAGRDPAPINDGGGARGR